MEKIEITKKDKTFTINQTIIYVGLFISLFAILGNIVQPFVWSAEINAKIEALVTTDKQSEKQRDDHEIRVRKLEETQIPLAELKVKVESLIKQLDALERRLLRLK